MKNLIKTTVKYNIEDLEPHIHSINAFFTCFIDYEHSGKDFNISGVETSDALAVMYFGATVNGELVNAGYQTKNLYKLAKFITERDLWPTVKRKKGSRFKFFGSKIESDKSFREVVAALREVNDPELNECIRSYSFVLFPIAYTAVGLIGHQRLMKLQPGASGRLAYTQIVAIMEQAEPGFFKIWFKRIFRFAIVASVAVGIYKILSSGYITTLLAYLNL